MVKLVPIFIFFSVIHVRAQHIGTDTIGANKEYENILNQKLFSDSLSSSFIILIRNEVKEHKHAFHSEHICVLEGSAKMTLNDSAFVIRKNDVVFIPVNTWHSVKVLSKEPLKVLSVQSPYFDGTDRIFKN